MIPGIHSGTLAICLDTGEGGLQFRLGLVDGINPLIKHSNVLLYQQSCKRVQEGVGKAAYRVTH